VIGDNRIPCNILGEDNSNISYLYIVKHNIQNKDQLLLLLKLNGLKIKAFGVEKISLFGSFAHGTPTAKSDVDLLVFFKPEQKNFDNFMDLSFFLEELLGRKVELVTPQSLDKYIGPQILNQAENVVI
jgi:predicted nucleotidyltransferase